MTHSAKVVDKWISRIYDIHRRRLSNLIIGLDIEWLPYSPPEEPNPAAIVQICVGHRCLIFQILHAHSVPESLREFLAIQGFTFVGVGVQKDADKLFEDWNLKVEGTMDLAEAAADKYKVAYYRNIGLKRLAVELIGKLMKKPKHVTLSQWDSKNLSVEQVEYAAIDAYICFELGMSLMKNGNGRRSATTGHYNDPVKGVNAGPVMDHYYDDPNPFDDDPYQFDNLVIYDPCDYHDPIMEEHQILTVFF